MRLEPVLCDKRGTSVRSPGPQKELGRPVRLEPVLCNERGTSVRSPAPQKELGRPVHLELVLCNERRHFSAELCTTGKSSPCLPQPGKVRVQQRRPSVGKNKYLKYPQKKKERKKSENISTEFYTPFFPCHCLILHTMQSVHFLPAPSYNFSLFCGPFSVYSTV